MIEMRRLKNVVILIQIILNNRSVPIELKQKFEPKPKQKDEYPILDY